MLLFELLVPEAKVKGVFEKSSTVAVVTCSVVKMFII